MKAATMIPLEIRVGPFEFEWDDTDLEIVICRGGKEVCHIEHVFKDTWVAFVEAVRPYQGPG